MKTTKAEVLEAIDERISELRNLEEQTEFIDRHIEMLEQFNRELIRGGEQ